MTLLSKKVAGLGFVLLGGLAAAHGGAAGQKWEMLVGLLVVMLGVSLLVAKIVRRNVVRDERSRSADMRTR